MPKPSKPTGRGGLSRVVRKAMQEHAGAKSEPLLVFGEVSDYLLRKLRLSPSVLQQVQKLEPHMTRLLTATAEIKMGRPISAKTAAAILSVFAKELPEYASRQHAKIKIDSKETQTVQARIMEKLNEIRQLSPYQKIGLPPPLIDLALDCHLSTMASVMGEQKFWRYWNAYDHATHAIARAREP